MLSAAIVAYLAAPAFGQKPDAGRDVAASVQEAIRLLKNQRHLEFIKTFMPPLEVERLVAKFGTLEKLAGEFGKDDRPAILLRALEAAAKLEPAFSEGGTVATFTFTTPVGRERGVTLRKIGDRWYFVD
jgi:hypothetical protein